MAYRPRQIIDRDTIVLARLLHGIDAPDQDLLVARPANRVRHDIFAALEALTAVFKVRCEVVSGIGTAAWSPRSSPPAGICE